MDIAGISRRALGLADGRMLDTWIDDGDGTPLIFHFGTPMSGLPFEPFVEAARERSLRWASWSRPGYGSSSRHVDRSVASVVGDTRELLAHMGAERAYVIGWSGGGPHALACAALMPDVVIGATTLASVAPYQASGLDWLAEMGNENVEEFGAAAAGPVELATWMDANWPGFKDVTGDQVAEAFGDLVDDVDRGALTGDFADYMAAAAREALREGYWGWFDDDMAFVRDWGFSLSELAVPVHVWQGAHDRMVPFAHGEWLAANCAGGCPHLLPEHGHLSLTLDSFGAVLDEMVRGR